MSSESGATAIPNHCIIKRHKNSIKNLTINSACRVPNDSRFILRSHFVMKAVSLPATIAADCLIVVVESGFRDKLG